VRPTGSEAGRHHRGSRAPLEATPVHQALVLADGRLDGIVTSSDVSRIITWPASAAGSRTPRTPLHQASRPVSAAPRGTCHIRKFSANCCVREPGCAPM
jgi:hypothetical protein